eukprot:COSAG01_NODE_852_length_13108_cov_7.167423_11_plen_123_part_00
MAGAPSETLATLVAPPHRGGKDVWLPCCAGPKARRRAQNERREWNRHCREARAVWLREVGQAEAELVAQRRRRELQLARDATEEQCKEAEDAQRRRRLGLPRGASDAQCAEAEAEVGPAYCI